MYIKNLSQEQIQKIFTFGNILTISYIQDGKNYINTGMVYKDCILFKDGKISNFDHEIFKLTMDAYGNNIDHYIIEAVRFLDKTEKYAIASFIEVSNKINSANDVIKINHVMYKILDVNNL